MKRRFYYSRQCAGWIIEGIAMIFPTKQDLLEWWANEHDMWEDKNLQEDESCN